MIFPSIKIVESVLPENGPVVPDKSVVPALLPSHFWNKIGGIQYRNNLRSVLPANYPVVPVKSVLPEQLPSYFRNKTRGIQYRKAYPGTKPGTTGSNIGTTARSV